MLAALPRVSPPEDFVPAALRFCDIPFGREPSA